MHLAKREQSHPKLVNNIKTIIMAQADRRPFYSNHLDASKTYIPQSIEKSLR